MQHSEIEAVILCGRDISSVTCASDEEEPGTLTVFVSGPLFDGVVGQSTIDSASEQIEGYCPITLRYRVIFDGMRDVVWIP